MLAQYTRLLHCVMGVDNHHIADETVTLRNRLRQNNSLQREMIGSFSAKGDIAAALENEFHIIQERKVTHYTLAIVTDGVCLRLSDPITRVLQKLRNYFAADSARRFEVFLAVSRTLLTNNERNWLNDIFNVVIFFEPENVKQALAEFETHLQAAISPAVADTPAPPVHNMSDTTRPLGPKEKPPSPSDPMSQVSESLRPYISPRTFHYHPLPTREEDPHPEWWYPENEQKVETGVCIKERQWVMAAASRRGLSHQHQNSQRDDAFAMSSTNGWNILAVADGAGSAKFSRVTANESTRRAVETVKRNAPVSPISNLTQAKLSIEKAVHAAISDVYNFQESFNRKNSLDKRDTYCTFLMLVHQPFEDGNCLFSALQIGDGYMMAASPTTQRSSPIAAGDHGSVSNESLFVLNFSKNELLNRVTVTESPAPMELFLMVTDGIEEDMKPGPKQDKQGITVHDRFRDFAFELKLQHLIWPEPAEWGKLLDWRISYERKGSFDDRTIAILTTPT